MRLLLLLLLCATSLGAGLLLRSTSLKNCALSTLTAAGTTTPSVLPLRLKNSGDGDDDDDTVTAASSLKGSDRREIRALANKLKSENRLQCASINVRNISDSAVSNIEKLLLSDELLQVKLNVEKKRDAKLVGAELALSTQSELVQTVGHSVLLYRPGTRSIVQTLLKEQQQRAAAAASAASKK